MTQPTITNYDNSGIPTFNPVYRPFTILLNQVLSAGTIGGLDVNNKFVAYNSSTSANSNTAQVSTITLTGTSGTANVNVEGTDYLATFNTSLTQTAADFVTAHAATILAAHNITVTSSGAGIILTSNVTGKSFTFTITNVTTNLAGSVALTTAPAIAIIPNMVLPYAVDTTGADKTNQRILVSGEVNNNNLVLVNSNDSLNTVVNGRKISEHLRDSGIIATPVNNLSVLDNQ